MKVPLYNRSGDVVAHAQISRQDAGLILDRKWAMSANGYAISSRRRSGKIVTIRMHRLILGLPNRVRNGVIADHINGDKLDNRRSNLRRSNKSLNAVNSGLPSNNTSGVRGVWLHRQTRRWCAEVKKMGKKTYLGLFVSLGEATKARRQAMKKLFGEIAR